MKMLNQNDRIIIIFRYPNVTLMPFLRIMFLFLEIKIKVLLVSKIACGR